MDSENIRLAVASQPTVEQSVVGLLRAISGMIREALGSGNPSGLEQLGKHIDAEPKAWSDAVLANTPQAIHTVGLSTPIPSYIADKFAMPGTTDSGQQPAEAAGEPSSPAPGGEPGAPEPTKEEGAVPDNAPAAAHESPAQPYMAPQANQAAPGVTSSGAPGA